ncbi:Rieske (2Fe-2S) protein [Dactylosporangium sp. NPDC051541]|uniref:Rieske (2Fe-2S) protein n=1 Tax=Dactylosporangium sp. NPDC051541 TaxID=3363977 RepID=UPI0037B7AB9B
MTEDRVQPALCAHRRALLAGIGGLGAVSLLAACGDDGATANTPAAPPAEQAAGKPPASTGANAGASTGASARTGPVGQTGEVPVGGGVVQNGVLIVQPVSGTFKVFDAACPHKGVLVKAPENGVVLCPAHASKFNPADGAKISGPTPSGLKELKSEIDGTTIMRME